MADSTSIGSLHYDVDLDDGKLNAALGNADKSVKSFGDNAQAAFRDAAKVLAGVSVGLTAFAKNATDFTVNYVKNSKALGREIGVSTTEASRLVSALSRMGIEATTAGQMFGIFSKKIVESTTASKDNQLATEKLQIDIEKTKMSITAVATEIQKHGDKSGELTVKLRELNNTLAAQQNALSKSADSFQKLGISTVDSQGKQKDFNSLLFEVADKFKAMPNGIDKTAIALDLFGRSGKDMVKVLNLGSAGISDLEKQADKLGLTLNPTTIASINKLVESQKDLKRQTDALKIAVGTATAPVLTEFNQKINDVVKSMMSLQEPFHSLTVNTLAFGGPISGAAASIAAFLGNISSIGPKTAVMALRLGTLAVILAGIGAVAFEVYQHWTMFGNKLSEVGNQITSILQPAFVVITTALQPFITALSTIWQILVAQLGPALGQIWQSITRLWAAINPAFTDLLKVLGVLFAVVLVSAIALLVMALAGLAQAVSWIASGLSNVINWVSNFIGWLGTAAVATAHAVAVIGQWFLNLPLVAANAISGVISWFMRLPGSIASAIGSVPGLIAGMAHHAVDVLWGFYGDFVDAGYGLIRAFANGIKGAAMEAYNAAKGVVQKVRNLLPFSDAKEGPLSKLTLSGRRFSETFAKGIMHGAGAIQAAVNSSLVLPSTSTQSSLAMSQLSNGGLAPTIYGSTGGGAAGSSSGPRYGDTNITIGQVNDKSDADYILNRIDHNAQLAGMGATPS